MIFGLWKRPDQSADLEQLDEENLIEQEELDQEDSEPLEELDQWEELDLSRDWREDGPFDISEVDLTADDVERMDLGCIILTPFDGMDMKLQINQQTKQLQAVLITKGKSAIEIALFAAPAQTTMMTRVRNEMIEATEKAGGEVLLAEGPFGTEIRRILPVKNAKGRKAFHLSKTWFVEGPKWLLRGVVMGEAAEADQLSGVSELLYEFFCNTVVRRDSEPRVPGDLIPMSMPKDLDTSTLDESVDEE